MCYKCLYSLLLVVLVILFYVFLPSEYYASWITALSTLSMAIIAWNALEGWKKDNIFKLKISFTAKLLCIIDMLNKLMSSKKFISMDFEQTKIKYSSSITFLKLMIEHTLKDVMDLQKDFRLEKQKIRVILDQNSLKDFDEYLEKIDSYWHSVEEFLIEFDQISTNESFREHVNKIIEYKNISKTYVEKIKVILKEIK